jgi:type IV secretory pathway VirB10-like protein
MYVTRRLLRSTMPAEPTREKEEPFLPPPTPKRRAAVRASAKICEVVTDAAGPAVRSRAAKTSPRQTENGGDEKNKSRNKKKTKKESQMQQEDEAPAEDASSLHGYQLMVDVHYRGEQYMEARILDLDPHKELLFVHYMGWNARFDAWVPVDEVTAHGSHSGAAKKKDAAGTARRRCLLRQRRPLPTSRMARRRQRRRSGLPCRRRPVTRRGKPSGVSAATASGTVTR